MTCFFVISELIVTVSLFNYHCDALLLVMTCYRAMKAQRTKCGALHSVSLISSPSDERLAMDQEVESIGNGSQQREQQPESASSTTSIPDFTRYEWMSEDV